MNLPWCNRLGADDIIASGDYTTRMSVFWEDGWDLVDDIPDIIGLTVAAANSSDMDADERVYVRPNPGSAA